MTRTQSIDQIKAQLDELSDDQLAVLADMASTLAQSSVYATLDDADKAQIDAALDRLDAGQGVAWADVKSRLGARLKAAGV